MNRDLIKEILRKRDISENGLRTTLSRIKKRHDLRSVQQAACYYIKRHGLDLNVSSIIDDVTRGVLLQAGKGGASPARSAKTAAPRPRTGPVVPKVKWLSQKHYTLADRLSDFYPYLFIFENALREKIETTMGAQNPNWWDSKLKNDLPKMYEYAQGEKQRQEQLPMVGRSNGTPRSIDYLTLGQLEEIVQKYRSLFVPSTFPTEHFFTGHMVIVKRVRNAVAHMATSTTARDVRNARNEIDILLQHLATL